MGVWIGIGVVFILVSIILYACIRVGAEADREMEKFFEKKE